MNLNLLNVCIDEKIATVEINRPKALNALNSELLTEMGELFASLNTNSEVGCIVLTGSGDKSFVAGADIKEMTDLGESDALKMSKKGQDVFLQIETCSKPVIAAVNGYALGGGFELALACDVIIASDKAQFGLPEVSLGLIPGYGGTQRLARIVGAQKAKRLIFSGEMLPANLAYDWGVATQVVASDELMATCMKLAKKIVKQAPLAISFAKQSIANGYDTTLGEGLGIESHFFAKTFTTNDKSEGVTAFIEKRKPQFKGN